MTSLSKNMDKKSLLADIRAEFKTLKDVWIVELNEKNNLEAKAGLYKVQIKFKESKDGMKASISLKWSGLAYLFILASLPFFLVPWMIYTLFIANPRMNKAKRIVQRILQEKYSESSNAA